jgi:hypothetical protein
LPKADIVLKDGRAIEIGGPRKAERGGASLRNQIRALTRHYGAGKAEVYLEDNGGSASQRAKEYAIQELTNALGGNRTEAECQVHTFSSSDKLCV